MAGRKAYRLFENETKQCLVSPIHLRNSAKQAKKGVGFTPEISAFFFDLETQVLELSRELKEEIYYPRPFDVFVVNDNKPRLIQAAHFRDRVVHHAICSLIVPFLERSYLANSFACQKGKGTHKALSKAKQLAKRYSWVAKLDVFHFFETIPHERLLFYLRKRIGDRKLMGVLQNIIAHGHSAYSGNCGLPIGNLTSQHFGNFYLDVLDHQMKEKFGVKDFIRYMDDIVVFSNSKRELIDQISLIQGFVEEDLLLRLKDSETHISPIRHGFPFLGFRLYEGVTRLSLDRKQKLKYKLTMVTKLSEQEQYKRLPSIINWMEQAQTRQLRRNWLLQGRLDKTRTE